MGLFPSGGNRSRPSHSNGGGSKGSRAASVFFRLMQLISAAVVAGLLGKFLHNLHEGGGVSSRRVVYAISIAGISIFFSLLFMLPLKYQFYAFPLDLIMFILWIVAFGLLANLARGCSSGWYINSWSWAWGRRYLRSPGTSTRFTGSGCSAWRAALAFTFISAIFWLLSFLLGLYFLNKNRSREVHHEEAPRIKRQEDTHVNSGVAPVYHETNRNQTTEYRTTPAETAQYRTTPAETAQYRTEPSTYVQPTTHTSSTAGGYVQPYTTEGQEYVTTSQYPTTSTSQYANGASQYANTAKTAGTTAQNAANY
ncbi:hypothetical protein V495_05718 [Pseudogymnoascus sp. VKM F-4514 (FW-929)]|nr:hypothetical protein V495_05718 [Pseudogymnoascus sp. VKM F-4514 (FW-929)]KFY57753.1 hypothetical protein V497_05281 [Pseudogymnoascus sp. VKM F-4516 (FW-969)]